MTAAVRPIRFGTGAGPTTQPEKIARAAQRAEELGFSTFAFADHFSMPFGPLVAAQAVVDATTTLRVAHLVLDHDFRHPAVLAKELATLDALSNGRLEVGIGAGWMSEEYEQAGITFDGAPVRIERLEEYAIVLKGLFGEGRFSFAGKHFVITDLEGTPKPAQRPRPPIVIGGAGPKVLGVAARQADTIQVLPRPAGDGAMAALSQFSAAAYREKVEWIREVSGARAADIELSAQLLNVTITDDPDTAMAELAGQLALTSTPRVEVERELLASPVIAIGSLGQVCDKLLETRETYGISYFIAPIGVHPKALAPVIAAVAGR